MIISVGILVSVLSDHCFLCGSLAVVSNVTHRDGHGKLRTCFTPLGGAYDLVWMSLCNTTRSQMCLVCSFQVTDNFLRPSLFSVGPFYLS
ncbi:hypothetical protein DER45DRAFT_555334 [Fusarium avenaceum]|nr:hypothetical protein DER45DRAFT_555334 [Fusarium avenaceum]